MWRLYMDPKLPLHITSHTTVLKNGAYARLWRNHYFCYSCLPSLPFCTPYLFLFQWPVFHIQHDIDTSTLSSHQTLQVNVLFPSPSNFGGVLRRVLEMTHSEDVHRCRMIKKQQKQWQYDVPYIPCPLLPWKQCSQNKLFPQYLPQHHQTVTVINSLN